MDKEIWKDIPGYDYYQVSNKGRVKSFIQGKEKILKSPISGKYQQVNLSRNGKAKHFHVHVLVAMAFLEYSPHMGCPEVDHIKGAHYGDGLDNLRVVTHRFNSTVGFSKNKHKFSSQYVGVSFDKKTNRWNASITINGKNKKLGSFQIETDAANAYQKELLKL